MRKIGLLSGVILLAACSGAQQAEPVTDETTAADEETVSVDPSMWTSAEDAVGTYNLTYADGTEGTISVTSDGAVNASIGGAEFTATVTAEEPGRMCYSNFSGDDAPVEQQCWVNSPANEDGSWEFTGDDGTTGTARPAE